ncbi:MAG: inorganic phosphate transporter [Alphaproteobacteria bacterium]|nr:inorganic phosphate transporter [Alphaproteobacteria bacterium]
MIFRLLMTWGIGANDVDNALGTSVGYGAITVRTAIIIAAIFEFLGAAFAGGHVTRTIRKGIIDPTAIVDQPEILVFGMLAALLATAIWLAMASWKGWPVSTTHSIVGALVGFGIAGIGIEAVNWGKISQIAASWVISPVVGGVLAFGLMISIQRLILRAEKPLESAIRWAPAYSFLVGFVMALVTLFKGLKNLDLELSIAMSFLLAAVFGLVVALVGRYAVRRIKVDPSADRSFQFTNVEQIFVPLMIFTACAMAFAHGSNDVANGIGPLAAVFALVSSGGDVGQTSAVPFWVLVLGGGGIVLGLATYGYRVMQTIGRKITELTPSSGFCATMAAAATVVLASRTGIPVSTTHIAVGAVMGVGLARGFAALDLRVIRSIFAAWVVTLPVNGILAAILFFTLKGMFT